MTDYGDLEGKTALVTGAGSGMGCAIAEALANSGATVVGVDIKWPDSARPTPHRVTADISDEAAVAGLIDTITAQHVQLDIAVNAAAVEFELARLDECGSEAFDRLMAVNLRGLFLCMKYELKAMLAIGSGVIVNLASTTSTQPGSHQPAYTTSKFGAAGLTKQAALDYAADGIRVNAIAPGNIDTPMLRSALERRSLDPDRVRQTMPFKRFGRVEEIASAALWLCSDASSFTTGHILPVEGGMLNRSG